MSLWRRLIGGLTLVVGGLWLASAFGFVALRSDTFRTLWTALFVLVGIGAIMDWRSRKNHPLAEPSPARSIVTVIIATGAVAAVLAVRNNGYALSAAIAMTTVLAAILAFRFASKNRDHIGEVRFDTSSNDG